MSEGKQIDWSKAPADATHWEPDGEANPSWMKCDNLGWAYWDDEWFYFEGISASRVDAMIKRPTAWTGTGLPPVGTVCEIHGTVGQELRDEEFSWRQVEIIAHTNFGGGDVAVGRDLECATLGWGIASKFRPLRTPEQIAAEEREKAVREMLLMFSALQDKQAETMVGDLMAALYDAGYRKAKGEA